jgi:hypothetical protein
MIAAYRYLLLTPRHFSSDERAKSQVYDEEVGKLLSKIWRIKGMSEQEYGPNHPITKKLSSMHVEVQTLLQEK